MGDFNSRNSSSDKRNRKNFFSKTGNSATEIHKLLTANQLAKGSDIPQKIINKEKQKKALREIIDTRPQNIIIPNKDIEITIKGGNSKENDINIFSLKQEQLSYYLEKEISKTSHGKYNIKEIIYQLIQDEEFGTIMYTEGIKKNINQVTNNLIDMLSPYSTTNPQIKDLIHKFIPQQKFSEKHFLPVSKENSKLGPLLSNFIENLIFCELLVQGFANDNNSNIITINDRDYTVYVGSIQEDINGIDITLIDHLTDDYIGIDITRNTSKKANSIGAKATQTHKDIIIFNYSSYKGLFRYFMEDWIEYLKSSNPGKKPILKNDFALMRIKGDIRRFMESYQEHQKNKSSDGDGNTDSNVESDESNSHRMTSQ